MALVDVDPEARERPPGHISVASLRYWPISKASVLREVLWILFHKRAASCREHQSASSRFVLGCFERIEPVHSGVKLPSAGYHIG